MGLFEIVIILIMLGFNSLFAAYELALASVNINKLRQLAEEGKKGAAAALSMKNRMEASLAVVQIGITLVGAIAAATGGAGAEEKISPWITSQFNVHGKLADLLAITVVVLPLSAFTIVIGELVPKTFALRKAEWVCLKFSYPMKLFLLLVYPAVLFFEWITQKLTGLLMSGLPSDQQHMSDAEAGLHELRAQAQMLRTTRVIGAQEERIILGASKLSRQKVRDILVPAQDIVMLYTGDTLADHLIVAHLEAHTRLLVTQRKDDPQGIIGYVNVKELLFVAKTHPETPHVEAITRPAMMLDPDLTVGAAFARMMAEHAHLALIKDVAGKVHGMITLEDILEEVVGDIQDEFDRLPRHITPLGRQWVVGGGATLQRIRQATGHMGFGADFPPQTPLWELVDKAYEPVAKGGDVIVIDNVRILVRKVRRQSVFEVMIDVQQAV